MSYKIRLLKAEHGDAIIVDIPEGDGMHHIVIDGGPSSKFCVDEIVNDIEALGAIDLMVLTHFDDDHIGGLLEYFEKHKDGTLPIKNCWVNCASQARINAGTLISYDQAHSLENLLDKCSRQQTLEWKDSIVNTMEPIDMGFCKIQVLSPSPDALRINMEEYAKKDSEAIVSATSTRAKIDEGIALPELAKRPDVKHSTKEDIINKSSIAFILEEGNTKVLFMGDAEPWIVMEKLKSIGYTKDIPLYLNYWKLSHHGSRNNLCNELLSIIRCSNFIVSTNGGSGRS
jgi:beta-lactamase superfamily II metal-dependent hydrolase